MITIGRVNTGFDGLSIRPVLNSWMHASPPPPKKKKTLTIFMMKYTLQVDFQKWCTLVSFQWSLIVHNFDLNAVYAMHLVPSLPFLFPSLWSSHLYLITSSLIIIIYLFIFRFCLSWIQTFSQWRLKFTRWSSVTHWL